MTASRINTRPPPGPRITLEQEQVAFGVCRHDLEVESGNPLVTEAPRHSGALEDARWGSAGTYGAGSAVVFMVTVAGPLPLEIMALHGAGEAPALAGRGDIDLVAGRVYIHTQFLAHGVRRNVVDPELHQSSPWVDPRLRIMAGQGLVDRAGAPGAVGHLERGIAVGAVSFDLDNADRCHTDNRDRDGALALVPIWVIPTFSPTIALFGAFAGILVLLRGTLRSG